MYGSLSAVLFVTLGLCAIANATLKPRLKSTPLPQQLQPSFDCGKAKSAAEKTICQSVALADLDRLLGQTYDKKLKDAAKTKRQKFVEEQKAWMEDRDQCVVDSVPDIAWECLHDTYVTRIRSLGGTDELVELFRRNCQGSPSDCYELGVLETELKRWADISKDLAISCDEKSGELCFMRAVALVKLDKKNEAISVAKHACELQNGTDSNESCALEFKLRGQRSTNTWSGLYRDNHNGTLFVKAVDSERVSLSAEISDMPLSSCSWSKEGRIHGDHLIVEPDPENANCKLEIRKNGVEVIVRDPGGHCTIAYCGAHSSVNGVFKLDPALVP